jgi:hypothetical protein
MDNFDFQIHQLALIEKRIIKANKILTDGKFISVPIRFTAGMPLEDNDIVPTLSIFYTVGPFVPLNESSYKNSTRNWLKITIRAKI